jgi:hypothetical protein
VILEEDKAIFNVACNHNLSPTATVVLAQIMAVASEDSYAGCAEVELIVKKSQFNK